MIRALLLHLANSGYPSRSFYALKAKLLRKYGTPDGYDVQEIVRTCWGWRGGDYDDHQGCTHDAACRCRGTGVFSRRIVVLDRWRWGRFRFHIPNDNARLSFHPRITIHVLIKHRKYGRLSNEATLWLYLLCGEFRLFWQTFTGSCSYGWYAWPLINLQRLVAPLLWKLRRHDCIYCGRSFFTWGSGWCVCKPCRKHDRHVEEVPF